MPRLIDADAFREKWRENRKMEYLDDYAKGFQAGILTIDAQPTVDAEPVKHAHWADVTPVAATWGRRFKCSICGRCVAILPLDYSKGVVSIYPYCHCGAKMDEVPSNG